MTTHRGSAGLPDPAPHPIPQRQRRPNFPNPRGIRARSGSDGPACRTRTESEPEWQRRARSANPRAVRARAAARGNALMQDGAARGALRGRSPNPPSPLRGDRGAARPAGPRLRSRGSDGNRQLRFRARAAARGIPDRARVAATDHERPGACAPGSDTVRITCCPSPERQRRARSANPPTIRARAAARALRRNCTVSAVARKSTATFLIGPSSGHPAKSPKPFSFYSIATPSGSMQGAERRPIPRARPVAVSRPATVGWTRVV